MTWTLVQKSAAETSATATSITPNLPAGSTAGNLIVANLINGSGTATYSLPAGWIQAAVSLNAPGHAEVWYLPPASNPGGISSVVCTSSNSATLKGTLSEYHTDVASPVVTLNVTGTGIAGAVASDTVTGGTVAAAGDLGVCTFNEHFTAAAVIVWTGPSGFTVIQSDTASSTNHMWSGYNLSVAGGSLSVTGTSSVAADNAHGWSGALVTFTATAGGGGGAATGFVGAFLNASNMGVATMAQAISLWQTITARSLDVHRVFFGPGGTPAQITADLSADAAAGRKVCLSLKPAYNPPTTADSDAINTFLASCKAAGLIADVALWHEPYYGGITSAAQFITMFQFYAPVVRQYYPSVFCTSAGSVNANNEISYYPGDSYVDKVATDFYCNAYIQGIRLDAAFAPAFAANPQKPVCIWESNSSTDPSLGQTQAQSTAYFGYMQSYFVNLHNTGKPYGDICIFNAQGNLIGSTTITSSSDYRVALYQSLYDAVSNGGSGGVAPVTLASQIDLSLTMATSLVTTSSAPVNSPSGNPPGWPQLFFEAGFIPVSPQAPAGTMILDTGRLDSARLGPGTNWTDISAFTRLLTITRPFTRVQGPLLTYQAGTCQIVLDNADCRFDPDNLAGPYVVNGVSQVRAMIPVRVRAVLGNAEYQLFAGFADSWLDTTTEYSAGYQEVTLNATDGFKILQGQNLAPLPAPAGDGELSGARITRILNAAGWYTDHRRVAAGDSTVQGTSFGADPLSLLQLTADTEIGELYADGGGNLVYRNRHAILTDPRSAVSQAIFGDLPA